MYENNLPTKRYNHTLKFLQRHIEPDSKILDLGIKNPFSKIMSDEGFSVSNTSGEDLDTEFGCLEDKSYDVVTAFEIFEHMLAPYNILSRIKSKELIATIPLRLWFSSAYRNKNDKLDCHYHEFEDWQFDWLLEKSGWKIIDREKWTSPISKIGFRPILRTFIPRYYAVYAKRV